MCPDWLPASVRPRERGDGEQLAIERQEGALFFGGQRLQSGGPDEGLSQESAALELMIHDYLALWSRLFSQPKVSPPSSNLQEASQTPVCKVSSFVNPPRAPPIGSSLRCAE